MIDTQALNEPYEALWHMRLRQQTRELISDRGALARQIREQGTQPTERGFLAVRPLIRRRDSLAGSSWLAIDRDYVWWVTMSGSPTNVDTADGPACAWRASRTSQLETSLEVLLGRLYRLQAEADAAGIRWADLVSSAVAG